MTTPGGPRSGRQPGGRTTGRLRRLGLTTGGPSAAPDTQRQQEAAAVACGHTFIDPALLALGLTHASAFDEVPGQGQRLYDSNERLEFLGDALLGAAVAHALYLRFPDADEGRLSQAKARIISRATLAGVAQRCDLVAVARLSSVLRVQQPVSVLANLVEGLLGAVFRDGGWPALAAAVERLLAAELHDALALEQPIDAKSRLQIACLAVHRQLPVYSTVRDGGSDHAPRFSCRVSIADLLADGQGGSRREAESAAAEALLTQLPSQEMP